jgi:ribA/ribD-fused uncharacterized protein
MSDLLFTEAKNMDGSDYKFGDWQRYAVHDDQNIKGFFGEYRFLSNFFDATWFEGLKYRSSECAYQSAKVIPELREPFITMSDASSKKAGKLVPKECILPDWNERRHQVMQEVVFSKFLINPDLREKLIETGTKFLREDNHWSDAAWGFDVKKNTGSNWLGQILMATRTYFQTEIRR